MEKGGAAVNNRNSDNNNSTYIENSIFIKNTASILGDAAVKIRNYGNNNSIYIENSIFINNIAYVERKCQQLLHHINEGTVLNVDTVIIAMVGNINSTSYNI